MAEATNANKRIDPSWILARRAGEVKRYTRSQKTLAILLGSLVLAVLIVFIIALLYSRTGSFTIKVGKDDMAQYGMILSEDRSFDKTTAQIDFNPGNITHNTVSNLPNDLDSGTGGERQTDEYISYTFFLKNTGEMMLTYQYELYFSDVTNRVDGAIRVRLYVNEADSEEHNFVTYARPDSSGNQIDGTEAFLKEGVVARKDVVDFAPGDVMRFTVVLWLEGNDEDCVDNILGGMMRLSLGMTVIEAE